MREDIYKCANALPITEEDYTVFKKVIKLKGGLKKKQKSAVFKRNAGH